MTRDTSRNGVFPNRAWRFVRLTSSALAQSRRRGEIDQPRNAFSLSRNFDVRRHVRLLSQFSSDMVHQLEDAAWPKVCYVILNVHGCLLLVGRLMSAGNDEIESFSLILEARPIKKLRLLPST
jgi:hypothetical protein